MPSSPFGVSFDTSVPESIYNQIFLEILERLGCSSNPSDATKATAEDVNQRYWPSVDMLMAHIFGQQHHPSGIPQGGKKQNFYDAWLPMVRQLNRCINKQGVAAAIDVTNFLPTGTLCSATDYLAGKPCYVKSNTKDLIGVDFGITLKKCPGKKDGNAFMALSCLGDMCANWLKTCSTNEDCGSEGHCLDIPIGDAAWVNNMVATVLTSMGMQTWAESGMRAASSLMECAMDVSSASLSIPWKFVNRLKNTWNYFFDASSTPSSTANLGVCFHKGLGASGVSSLGDDFTRRLNEYSSFSADIDTKAFTKVSKCKAAGCSNLGWIANGICDATCNVKDCDYDGGDCIADPGMLT
jgi:hypothetical protein